MYIYIIYIYRERYASLNIYIYIYKCNIEIYFVVGILTEDCFFNLPYAPATAMLLQSFITFLWSFFNFNQKPKILWKT